MMRLRCRYHQWQGLQPPTDNQIQYMINSVSVNNNKKCTMNDLKTSCEEKTTIPEDDDRVFVALKETYELCYQNTINFTTLIADNASAITNGFQKVFEMQKRVNCWDHVHKISKHICAP
ncbi:unnamed protein product [Brachionus calyciflorus]|uniref:MULE transposase domain-containing protein n=1 Tax=Brachionus calyciflorus TaxID=104777 RepID=A0A814FAR8_9BILA|nr:unnamed protein product [Brachionus calyciflorus]